MAVHIYDYVPIFERAQELGCSRPDNFTILPENFDVARSRSEFLYRPEAGVIKTLFRNRNILINDLLLEGERPSYITNKHFEWAAPVIFIAGSLLSNNSAAVSVGLGLITNYLTDFFQGLPGKRRVKISIVVETSKSKKTKKIEYEGDADGIAALSRLIKDTFDE